MHEVHEQNQLEPGDQPSELGIEQVPRTGDQAPILDPDSDAAISQDADDLPRISHQKTS